MQSQCLTLIFARTLNSASLICIKIPLFDGILRHLRLYRKDVCIRLGHSPLEVDKTDIFGKGAWGGEKLPALVKLTGSRVLGKFYLVISLFAKTDRLELGAQLESHCGPKISYSRAKMKCFYSFKGCSYQTNKVKEQKKMDVQGKLIPSAGRILCMSGLESRVKWPSEGHLNFPRSVTSVLSSKLIKV